MEVNVVQFFHPGGEHGIDDEKAMVKHWNKCVFLGRNVSKNNEGVGKKEIAERIMTTSSRKEHWWRLHG